MSYETILLSRDGRVGIVTLNRPKALNALCDALIAELGHALDELENDPEIGAIILTGSEKAFAAGADIKEMAGKAHMDMFHEDFFSGWEEFYRLRTPKIAAVSGFALGGGCELAMMCDVIYASKSA